MWRLWNKLFGWDYIAWRFKYSGQSGGISRVIVDKNETPHIHYYGGVYKKFSDVTDIVWLTCKPEKYLGNNK